MTALATTWTANTNVEFNAGTLATIASCVTYCENKLQRGTLSVSTVPSSTQLQQELIRAKEELCDVYGFTWQRGYFYASTVASQYRYAMPKDYFGGPVSLRDTTNDHFIEWISPYQYDLKYPDPSKEDSGEIVAFTVKDRELWLLPPPAAVYTMELEYQRSGDDSTATAIDYIPEVFRFRICDKALAECYRTLHRFDLAGQYDALWERTLLKAKHSDSKKKWKASGFQALSWQQEYVASYNQ
jgi:hypothetical protein